MTKRATWLSISLLIYYWGLDEILTISEFDCNLQTKVLTKAPVFHGGNLDFSQSAIVELHTRHPALEEATVIGFDSKANFRVGVQLVCSDVLLRDLLAVHPQSRQPYSLEQIKQFSKECRDLYSVTQVKQNLACEASVSRR